MNICYALHVSLTSAMKAKVALHEYVLCSPMCCALHVSLTSELASSIFQVICGFIFYCYMLQAILDRDDYFSGLPAGFTEIIFFFSNMIIFIYLFNYFIISYLFIRLFIYLLFIYYLFIYLFIY
jgi:hypothetical protein